MRRRVGSLMFTSSLALCACGSPPTEAATQSGAKPTPADGKSGPGPALADGQTETPVLSLGDAKIWRAGHPDRAIEIAANGQVTLAVRPFAILSPDGRMTDPQDELVMTAFGDGSVVGPKGPTGIQLGPTGGTYDDENLHIELSVQADGAIVTQTSGLHAALLGEDSPALVSEGCAGPMIQTCALVTLNYLMALGNPESPQQ